MASLNEKSGYLGAVVGRRFTFIIIPDGDGTVKRITLRSAYLRFAALCCCVVMGLLAFFAYDDYTNRVDLEELQRLRVATSEQRQTLNHLVADLDSVQQQMTLLSGDEARVRQLANLEPVSDALPVAVGGLVEPETTTRLDAVQRQINQLQVDIELRRQSQEVVRNLLNDQVSLSRATPKGWPTKGWLTSYFGMRKSPFTGRRVMHEGLDIAANVGTPVVATADGVVARVQYSPSYGKMVIIDHGYGYRTVFGHNSKILVKAGQRIKRGDVIAKVGNTGQSTGPHLHYELRLNGVPIDPRKTL